MTTAAPPCTPAGLACAAPPGPTALSLAWHPAADQGSPIQSYQLELCPAARLLNLNSGLSQVPPPPSAVQVLDVTDRACRMHPRRRLADNYVCEAPCRPQTVSEESATMPGSREWGWCTFTLRSWGMSWQLQARSIPGNGEARFQ